MQTSLKSMLLGRALQCGKHNFVVKELHKTHYIAFGLMFDSCIGLRVCLAMNVMIAPKIDISMQASLL